MPKRTAAWTVYPTNEGQDINFHYHFEGTQEEVIKEIKRVKEGLTLMFTFANKKKGVTQYDTFGCRAEGRTGFGSIRVEI